MEVEEAAFAHLLLRYDCPLEVEKIIVDFGCIEARSTANLLQLRQGEQWVDAFRITQNDESKRIHLLPPGFAG